MGWGNCSTSALPGHEPHQLGAPQAPVGLVLDHLGPLRASAWADFSAADRGLRVRYHPAMRILVLGASGGVGQHLVKLALERGHAVRALVREGSPFDAPGAEIRRGDVFDPAVLASAVEDRDAVVSALGLRRRSANPYSAITGGIHVVENALTALVPLLEAKGPKRLQIVSAGGVGADWHAVHPIMRFVFRTSSVAKGYADLAKAEALLEASTLDWQAVRPTTLTDGAPTGRVQRTNRYHFMARIPRADLAAFMLSELEKPSFAERRPSVTVTAP